MAIATAPVDFEAYDRNSKPTPLDGPALEALKACTELRSASLDALRSLSRQATLRPVGRGATVGAQGTRVDSAILVVRGRIRSVCRAPNGREVSVEVFRTGDLIADFVHRAAGRGRDGLLLQQGAQGVGDGRVFDTGVDEQESRRADTYGEAGDAGGRGLHCSTRRCVRRWP